MPLLRTTGVATAILALPFPAMVHAAIWQSSVALPTTVEYDSNPLLLTSKEKGVTRTIIAPDYNLVGTYGQDQLQFGLGVQVLRSSDTDIVSDREDPNVKFGWQRETEKGSYGLSAQYVESSTLSGAVQDSGVVTSADGTQKLYTLGGNWSAALTERSTLTDEIKYSDARYDIDSLTAYSELSNNLTWRYAFNERTELFSSFDARRYEPDDDTSAVASNSYTPSIGMKYQFSEQWAGSLNLGVNQVSGSEGGRRGEGGLTINYTGVRSDAILDVQRSTVANAQGGFAELDQVHGVWSYLVGETSRVGLDASWQDSKGQTPNTLQTYSAWASRELSPFFDLRLSLQYKERQQDGFSDAVATIIGLTVTYKLPDL